MKSFKTSIILSLSILLLAPATCVAMRSDCQSPKHASMRPAVQSPSASPLQFAMDDPNEINLDDIMPVFTLGESRTVISPISRSAQIHARPASNTRLSEGTPTIIRSSPFSDASTPRATPMLFRSITPMPQIEERQRSVPAMPQAASSSSSSRGFRKYGVADSSTLNNAPAWQDGPIVVNAIDAIEQEAKEQSRAALQRVQEAQQMQNQLYKKSSCVIL